MGEGWERDKKGKWGSGKKEEEREGKGRRRGRIERGKETRAPNFPPDSRY